MLKKETYIINFFYTDNTHNKKDMDRNDESLFKLIHIKSQSD